MPAAGYRHESSGALTNVGTWGLYFSSSSYAAGSINAGYLNFNAGNVNPLNNANRASGLSVRCVQHLRGELFKKLLPATLRRSGVAV
ncbi:MAG: fibrobacter succinogenes major paralogous domain-containing protein [Alistipes sp.]|nr:fibrobacter succinogenes major paralogous domain-containing protein [Alistipes sp.]